MTREKFDLAFIIKRFGKHFVQRYKPNAYILHTLNAITQCRTFELGGHENACDCCGQIQIGYNSCRNRHCPKCQGSKQTLWVDELISCAWDTIRTAGYTNFGIESGAVCVLHTWGQNLSLHPHVHCIVPAAGLSLAGNWKHVAQSGKYLFAVTKLSVDFRGYFLKKLKEWLNRQNLLTKYQSVLDKAWQKPWVVHCEPSLAGPGHVIGYLGNYTLRVAITNNRIINVTDTDVTFLHKDYAKGAKTIPISLDGVEFLRRFCFHILPKKFVKIRRFGVYSSRYKAITKKLRPKTIQTLLRNKETILERLLRVTGLDVTLCPVCKTGKLHRIAELPKIRSPSNFYAMIHNIC